MAGDDPVFYLRHGGDHVGRFARAKDGQVERHRHDHDRVALLGQARAGGA